ncbi:MAG: TIGR02391 family protein [Actinobacteria bacterium]|nr:TIGR02391 family protein [Actinomycetota bacterium]
MTQHTAAYLRRTYESLKQLQAAFDSFMELHQEGSMSGPGLGYLPTCWPKEGADPAEVSRRTDEVARLSGECAAVADLTGANMGVQGVGAVDPIMNWDTMLRPKAFLYPSELSRIITRCLGVLTSKIAEAEEAERTVELPVLGPASLHPTVWNAAAPFWTMHQLQAAVRAGADAVVDAAKGLGVRNDLPETSIWQQLFSTNDPMPGRPRLRWPGDPEDRDVKTMQDGLRQFAPGVQMTVRNPATHTQSALTEQEAFELLATLSILSRFVERCEVLSADPDEPQ